MSTLRVLIVDDEPIARDRLRRLLTDIEGIQISGECTEGRQAIESIQELSPDLVFLDVQMPEVDGFGVLAALPEDTRPAVIFTTAYDKFALRAFEVHAIDYLLKPFDKERLQVALTKAKRVLGSAEAKKSQEKLTQLIEEVKPQRPAPDRISVKNAGRITLIKPEDIDWVESADNYVNLHVGKITHMIRDTMNSMESQLEGKRFLRISRSLMVNIDRVKELHPLFHGDFVLVLHDGTKLNASRNYRSALKAVFGV